ncbi:MAG: hypothetical protein QXT13_04170 [Pyrobaculum sp.]
MSYLDTAPSFTTLDFVVSRDPPLLIQITHASAPDEVERIEAIREAKKAIGGEALVVTWDYGGELGGVKAAPSYCRPQTYSPSPNYHRRMCTTSTSQRGVSPPRVKTAQTWI